MCLASTLQVSADFGCRTGDKLELRAESDLREKTQNAQNYNRKTSIKEINGVAIDKKKYVKNFKISAF